MKCTFVAMGAENVSIQALSAFVKARGFETALAYDQALFDDKNFLDWPRVARLFENRHQCVRQIVESEPDLVAFTVMTPTYQWALDIATRVKQLIDVPILFGGIHPSTVPHKVIQEPCVDIVCVGEGDAPLADLLESMRRGRIDTSIKNLWFKTETGRIVQNPGRLEIQDVDSLPFPDKGLFEGHVCIPNYYLTLTARGCPFACTFCSLSFMAKESEKLGGKRIRQRSVDLAIEELRGARDRYHPVWIDIKNNTFTANRKWTLDFCRRYPREVGVPFKVFAHPLTMTEDVARALKDAGCWGVQLGVESYDDDVRRDILNRKEANEHIDKAVEAMDKVGLPYTLDYILGLPGQTEEELLRAAYFFLDRTACYRISPYMLAYLPKLDIIEHGLRLGQITAADVDALENGRHNHYLSTGSILGKARLRQLTAYRLLYRMISMFPRPVMKRVIDWRLFRAFPYLPLDGLLFVIDALRGLVWRDRDMIAYFRNYRWSIKQRFERGSPVYWRRRTIRVPTKSFLRVPDPEDARPPVVAPAAAVATTLR